MGKRVEFVCQSSTCRRQVEIAVPTGSGTGQVSHPRCAPRLGNEESIFEAAFRILSKEEAVPCVGDYGPQKSSGNLLTDRKTNFRFGGSHRPANNM